MQKRLLARYKSHTVASNVYAAGSIVLLSSTLPLVGGVGYWTLTPNVAIALVYAVLAASAINFTIITYVNSRVSAVVLTAAYPLEAIFAALICYVALEETITLPNALGGETLGLQHR